MSRRPSALPGFSVSPFEDRLERWQRWQSFIVTGLVAFLPWITVPLMGDGVEWPKFMACAVGVMVILAIQAIAWRRGSTFLRRDYTLLLPSALLIVSLFAFFRDGTQAERLGSFLGAASGGMVLSSAFLALASGLFVAGRVTKAVTFHSRALWLVSISHLLGSIMTLVALFQHMNGKGEIWFQPGGGVYAYALFSVGIWWAGLLAWSHVFLVWQKRLLGALLLSSCLVTLFFSAVFREWWAVLLLITPLVWTGFTQRVPRRVFMTLGFVVGAFTVAALLVAKPLFVARLSLPASFELAHSISGRARFIGTLDWEQAFTRWRPAELATATLKEVVFDRSYNLPLSFVVTHGYGGTLLILAAILGTLVWSWRYRRDETEAWLAMATGLFLGTLFVSPHILVVALFFLTLGLATHIDFGEEERSDARSYRPGLRSIATLFGVLIAFAIMLLMIARSTLEIAVTQNKDVTGWSRRLFQVIPSVEQRFIRQMIASEQQLMSSAGANERASFWPLMLNQAKDHVRRAPHHAASWELLARAYHLLQPYVEGADVFGLEAIDKSRPLAPTDPTLLALRGNILFAAAERKERERDALDVKAREPLETAIRDGYRRAAEAYGAALVLRGEDDVWRYRYAVALGRAGFVTPAREQLERLIERHPDEASLFAEAAVLAASEKQTEKAIAWLKKALSQDASLWQAAVLLSDLHAEKKEYVQARAVLQVLPQTVKEQPLVKDRLKRLEWEASSVRPVSR